MTITRQKARERRDEIDQTQAKSRRKEKFRRRKKSDSEWENAARDGENVLFGRRTENANICSQRQAAPEIAIYNIIKSLIRFLFTRNECHSALW